MKEYNCYKSSQTMLAVVRRLRNGDIFSKQKDLPTAELSCNAVTIEILINPRTQDRNKVGGSTDRLRLIAITRTKLLSAEMLSKPVEQYDIVERLSQGDFAVNIRRVERNYASSAAIPHVSCSVEKL